MKDNLSIEAARQLADLIERASGDFDRETFLATAGWGLEGMEMKQRVRHLADALAAGLPDDFPAAAGRIEAALASQDFTGWIVYPVDDFVARYGIGDPHLSLPLIAKLTPRWTCEYAIRPFIEAHREITFEYFDRWIDADDEHLRRLVSEGSRPRLPWGGFLSEFIEDPTPTIALLDRLVDDPSAYVRRSVANHLNDIAKDHPGLAIETGKRWLAGDPASARRNWVVGHGMRSLVKQGDPGALALLGFDPDAPVRISDLRVEPAAVAIGEPVEIRFRLEVDEPTAAMVDYRVHHAGAGAGAGSARSPKVFKLKKLVLKPGSDNILVKRHRFQQVSGRRIHPGPHPIEIQVNGRILAAVEVTVEPGG